MKILFMGTPEFAAEALRCLIAAGHEITAVVTQPDKPKGRSRELLPPPVKVCAAEHGIPVLQPGRIKTPEAVEQLKGYPADVYVVAAFGQILSQEILDIPRLGCLCIHASLLPRYRGASPMQHVIMDGEEKTGVTIMQMDAGVDTGDMLYRKELYLAPDETGETLHDKLKVLGGEAICEALPLLEQGRLVPRKQDDALSCYAPLIDKSMGAMDFERPAVELERLIRGLTPWPGTYAGYKGRQLKIWKAEAVDGKERGLPGEILETDKESVTVAAGEGALRVYELQLEGKKRMSAHDFLLGVKLQPGERLESAFGK